MRLRIELHDPLKSKKSHQPAIMRSNQKFAKLLQFDDFYLQGPCLWADRHAGTSFHSVFLPAEAVLRRFAAGVATEPEWFLPAPSLQISLWATLSKT
ncbi:MAG: hypothetical protein HC814_02845 [Rhodobacteraceae bacterium]|nr:hypothetical protein [Paracoccaceae bacterium]